MSAKMATAAAAEFIVLFSPPQVHDRFFHQQSASWPHLILDVNCAEFFVCLLSLLRSPFAVASWSLLTEKMQQKGWKQGFFRFNLSLSLLPPYFILFFLFSFYQCRHCFVFYFLHAFSCVSFNTAWKGGRSPPHWKTACSSSKWSFGVDVVAGFQQRNASGEPAAPKKVVEWYSSPCLVWSSFTLFSAWVRV